MSYNIDLSGYKKIHSGKVREIFDIDDKHLMIAATDRISAFDVVFNEPIPEKGIILTGISNHFMKFIRNFCKTHSTNNRLDGLDKLTGEEKEKLCGRSVIVRKAKRLDVECVIRGHLAGALYEVYKTGKRKIWGHVLPDGLKKNQRLPEPIFTPTTKAREGHDLPMSFETMFQMFGRETADWLELISIKIFSSAYTLLEKKGVILSDTKFEFGYIDDEIVLIDEALTPDSSRYWERDKFKLDITLPCLDKQTLRDYLIAMRWDRKPPPPRLPDDLIMKIKEVYQKAYGLITGDKKKWN